MTRKTGIRFSPGIVSQSGSIRELPDGRIQVYVGQASWIQEDANGRLSLRTSLNPTLTSGKVVEDINGNVRVWV